MSFGSAASPMRAVTEVGEIQSDNLIMKLRSLLEYREIEDCPFVLFCKSRKVLAGDSFEDISWWLNLANGSPVNVI
jgi:hypothetical protein